MTRLFQFRAGRCERRGETNIVDPLPSKGLLYAERNEEDGSLNHLCYKDLETGAVVHDFILFPGDASFKKVLVPDSATARVYVLCFSSSNQKVLYWMQNPDSTKDAENVASLNQLIVEDEQMPLELSYTRLPITHWKTIDNKALVWPLLISASILLMIVYTLQESPAATSDNRPTPLAAPEPRPQRSNLVSAEQMNQLQSIIAGFSNQSTSIGQSAFKLEDILTMEVIRPLLQDPQVLSSLESYLPPGLKADSSSVETVIRSTDFKAAVESFDTALRQATSGNRDDGLMIFLLHGLGLNTDQFEGVEGYVDMVLKDHSKR